MKFKVGDLVRVKSCIDKTYLNKESIYTVLQTTTQVMRVRCPNEASILAYADVFQLVEIKKSKLPGWW